MINSVVNHKSNTRSLSTQPTSRSLWDRVEGPTWLVFLGVYGAYGLLISSYDLLPWWLFCPLGAIIVAWHGSFQHELIHGHPTRSRSFNALLGWAPLCLWMPYHVYRDSHLAHHQADVLAKPGVDPESYYYLPEEWARMGPVRRAVMTANNTYLGRVTIGPAIAIVVFLTAEVRRVLGGNSRNVAGWIVHSILSVILLIMLERVFGIPAWLYCLGIAYPSISLVLTRSYLEHRPSDVATERTAVVEGSWFWSLLFLSVNFHVTHHEYPGAPWYKVPALYRQDRENIARQNGGYIYRSYGQLMRRHLLRAKDLPVYT